MYGFHFLGGKDVILFNFLLFGAVENSKCKLRDRLILRENDDNMLRSVSAYANVVYSLGYKYRLVAQACDHRTTAALARYPQSNDGFFLPQPKLHPSKVVYSSSS